MPRSPQGAQFLAPRDETADGLEVARLYVGGTPHIQIADEGHLDKSRQAATRIRVRFQRAAEKPRQLGADKNHRKFCPLLSTDR